MDPRRRRAAGFSLVELMIVVAIIGILAAVALPNFEKSRKRAKIATEIAHIGCVQSAMADYAVVNDGYPADISTYEDFIQIVNIGGCRFKLVMPRHKLEFYWCIKHLPDGSPYITQCIVGEPPEDYIIGLSVLGLEDPQTQLDALITVSSFDGVRLQAGLPSFPSLP